jgi:RNA polymerase sigma-70 factor (ECF subfamily)
VDGSFAVKEASGPTSIQLLRRAQRGDLQALHDLFARLWPVLMRWARGRLPSYARGSMDTADLVQEAFANAFKRLEQVEPRRRKALQLYLQESIRNRIRDEVRRAGRRGVANELRDDLPSPARSPHDHAQHEEEFRRYRAALVTLPPDDQHLIVARLELGYSYEQAALATGRPSADSARMAVRRALLKLAAVIGSAA